MRNAACFKLELNSFCFAILIKIEQNKTAAKTLAAKIVVFRQIFIDTTYLYLKKLPTYELLTSVPYL